MDNVDFVYSYLQAKAALQNLHDAMLENDFETAQGAALLALTETKLTLTAIKAMKEARERL